MFVYVLQRRSNTQCKTEKFHTAVSHRTDRSHTGHNARKLNPTKTNDTPSTNQGIDKLAHWLFGYDESETNYLIQGFKIGFYLGFVGEYAGIESKILNSAHIQPKIIDHKIQKEILSGRVQEPFDNKPFPDLQCSPLDLLKRKSQENFE